MLDKKKQNKSSLFVSEGLKMSAETTSQEGSLKYKTSGDDFVDQFATASMYRAPRAIEEIYHDTELLWVQDPLKTLKFILYLRTITRVVSLLDGTKTSTVQKGQGLRHESIVRLMWVAINHPEVFWKNVGLFISAGSWRDIFVLLSYDYLIHKKPVLDWTKFQNLIIVGLGNPNSVNLIKKYLPQIKSSKKCTTDNLRANTYIGKWIASFLFDDSLKSERYRKYRELKTSGLAHNWQQLISKKLLHSIDFDTIHGRALLQLVSSNFLTNNGLEANYIAWLESKPAVKFTGYPHELLPKVKTVDKLVNHEKFTINKQYQTLLNQARLSKTSSGQRVMAVLDISASMNSDLLIGINKYSPYYSSRDVALTAAIFFDDMLPDNNFFKNHLLVFSDSAALIKINGNDFLSKYKLTNLNEVRCGGTNFQSVIQFLIDYKKRNPNLDENLMPNTFVLFSDGEFYSNSSARQTQFESVNGSLLEAGYSKKYCDEFKLCLVDIPNNFYNTHHPPRFETFGDAKNIFYFSGFDLSPLGFLFGRESEQKKTPVTAKELFDAVMSQEMQEFLVL